MSEMKATSASAWRKPYEEGFVVELPSGYSVRLRPVALDVLLLNGSLPDLLTPIAAKALWAEPVDDTEEDDILEVAKGGLELMAFVCKASFLEPRIVDEITDESCEITLEHVSAEDKAAVFQIATQPAEVLKRFHKQQSERLASVSDSKNDGGKAKRSGGSS